MASSEGPVSSAVSQGKAEADASRLKDGTFDTGKYILEGSLTLLAKLRVEMEGASGKHLLDAGKLWMTTANGVFRAKRRQKEKA